MQKNDSYEVVIGLEIHAQLLTKSKLFCGDSIAFGAEPNTHVSAITLAHPGTLPRMNRKAIELAIKMGLACHCEIETYNYFARKNYFYPDLPKGYQVSQHTTPICKGGYITIKTTEGERNIQLNRIHMEEDAGKSLHDVDEENTSIDYNRAGTPLIEIVTEPDLRTADEAFALVSEIRKLVRYLDVCDGNMEEGSLRCDANVSVRKKGDAKLGTKVEVKNLNSMRHVKKAIEFEANRLIDILESGNAVVQQTRSYDAANDITFATRDKEDADDYRYFADPDLTPFSLDSTFISSVQKAIPALPAERINRYMQEWQLPEYDAQVLTEERAMADYYEELVAAIDKQAGGDVKAARPKAAANWMLGPVKSWLNENGKEIKEFPLVPDQLGRLILLVGEGKLSFSSASTRLFSALIKEPGKDPGELAAAMNLLQQSDSGSLEPVIDAVLAKFPEKVVEFKKGKKGLLSLFVGEVMKQSKGKADPKVTNELLIKKLSS